MAQIEQSDKGGKKKKGAQKKFSVHVDFTPMVDMNMLLLTFFMLCTTMLKSQTLQISMPSNAEEAKGQEQKVAASDSWTLILDTELNEKGEPVKNIVYAYQGNIKFVAGTQDIDLTQEQPVIETLEFLPNVGKTQQGIRALLYKENEELMKRYNALKDSLATGLLGEGVEAQTLFKDKAKALRAAKDIRQINVLVKPGPNATYECLINAIDELSLNQIGRYRIQATTDADKALLKHRGIEL